jgi:cellulose synthase operon protein C
MSPTPPASPVDEKSATLERIQALCDEGLLLQAWQTGLSLGPLRQWPGTKARVLAGRLASQLSADRLGDSLILRAWRADRTVPEAMLYGAMSLHSIRGSLVSLDQLNASGLLDADTPLRWEATAFAAWLHATFRDFETADALIARALDASGTAWIWAQRAAIHEMADRYPEALEASRHAMKLKPRSRSAIQYTARFLSLFERDQEAIDLLRDALGSFESPRIAAQLASLEFETGQFREALATLDRYEALTPVKDKGVVSWLAGRRCDIYGRLGDLPRSIEQARLSTSEFYKQVAKRLEQAAPDARRVTLPVGFVRQHHMTCAPATMSALSRYWSRTTDHLEMAEAICYDGTPSHSQRCWAIEHGWHVREFAVTWDAAGALLDAGIPFALATVHPGSAHLQAAIGYDAARGTLLIRDPYDRVHSEFAEAPFFESYRSTGPRGMAMVPVEERARLDAIDLPEVRLYDIAHEVQDALVAHDRKRAAAKCAEIAVLAPSHRIEIGVRRSLANYDNDLPAELRATEELLASYPDDVNLRLARAGLLRQLATHKTYLDYLRAQCDGPASHSLLRLRLACALLDDARTRDEAVRILRRFLNSWCKAETLSALADAHWQAGEYPRAVELYRIASTLEETDEDHARTYFRAARMVRGEERALAFLRHRIRRLGHLSARSAMTLFDCLEEIDRTSEAMTVLEEALAAHPEDGVLLLFAARVAAAAGDTCRADDLLDRAQGRSREMDWLRTVARDRQQRGELAEALRHWERVAADEPFDLGAQRAVTGLKHELGGRAAAVEYLRAVVARFPHHQGLGELLVDWLDEAPLPEQEEALLRLLDINPTNAWAQRQLAYILARQRRFAEAHARMATASELAPNTVAWHNVLGDIFFLEGRRDAAREQFRNALHLSVDSDFALNRLLEACGDIEERRGELAFVLDEMKRQVIYGDSLLVYQCHAHGTIEPGALMALLDEARAGRPDLWQTWVACVRQRVEMQECDPAQALCDEALARFPLLPRLHIERAEIARVAGDRAGERAALAEAVRLSPGWSLAVRKYADVIEAEGDFAASRQVIEAGLRRSPADAVLRGYLGHALWQLGERGAAIAQLEQAATLDPDYSWAWQALKDHATQEGRPDAAIGLARQLAAQRPGEVRVWLAVARVADDADERLAALDNAIAMSPLALEPNELKLDLLIERERYDEALALVDAAAWGEHPPVALQAKGCRVLAARGDVPAAIARMEKVLATDPNHHFGWGLLADWHAAREDWPRYLAATKEMCRIAPNDASSLGYFAHALALAEPETDIRPHLRRAQHLKPDYAYAGQALFDLELEAGDLDAAESALRTLTAHVDTGYTRWREIRLAVRRREYETALDLYWKMWAVREDDIEPFKGALQTLIDAGCRGNAERVIEGVVIEPEVNPHVGTLWVEHRVAARFPIGRFRGFDRVLANGAAGQRAAQELLRHYKKNKDVRALRRLLRRHGEAFARDDTTHGLAAYALVGAGLPRDAVAWFGDWRLRTGAAPWSLLNLVCALRDLGRDADAADVGRHALTRPRDHSFGEHSAWLAVDAGLAGDHAEAARLLGEVNEEELSDYYRFLGRIARALATLGGETAPLSGAAYARVVEPLRGIQKLVPTFLEEPALRRYVGKALWRVACARGGHAAVALGAWLYLAIFVL